MKNKTTFFLLGAIFATSLTFGMREKQKRTWVVKHNNEKIDEAIGFEFISGSCCCLTAAALGLIAIGRWEILPAIGSLGAGSIGGGLWGDAWRRGQSIDPKAKTELNGKERRVASCSTSEIYIKSMELKTSYLQKLLLSKYHHTKEEGFSIKILKQAIIKNKKSDTVTVQSDDIAALIQAIRRESNDVEFSFNIEQDKFQHKPEEMQLTLTQDGTPIKINDICLRAWIENYSTRSDYNICIKLDRTCQITKKDPKSKSTIVIPREEPLPTPTSTKLHKN